MKNIALVLLLVATVVLGGLYLRQTRTTIEAQTAGVALEQKVSESQNAAEEQEKAAAKLRQELELTAAEAAAKAQEASNLQKTIAQNLAQQAAQRNGGKPSAATPAKPESPMAPFAKLFNDPAMKDAIRTQQKATLGAMVDKNYAKLFSDLKLTPEQSASVKEMLLNKQLDAAAAGMAMLSDEAGATNRVELGQQIKASSDAADAKIKEFLGDANYAQLQTYEKSMADRTAINGFKDQLGGDAGPLAADQEQQLIDVMTQERQKFKFTTDLSGAGKNTPPADFASMFTEEKMATYFQEQDQLNQQYLNQAKSILSPAQLESFQKYLSSQQALQKAGMQMAAKMFATPK